MVDCQDYVKECTMRRIRGYTKEKELAPDLHLRLAEPACLLG
jgi:hypothetical protein